MGPAGARGATLGRGARTQARVRESATVMRSGTHRLTGVRVPGSGDDVEPVWLQDGAGLGPHVECRSSQAENPAVTLDGRSRDSHSDRRDSSDLERGSRDLRTPSVERRLAAEPGPLHESWGSRSSRRKLSPGRALASLRGPRRHGRVMDDPLRLDANGPSCPEGRNAHELASSTTTRVWERRLGLVGIALPSAALDRRVPLRFRHGFRFPC